MLNKGYDAALVAQLKEAFVKDAVIPHLLLQDIFEPSVYENIKQELEHHTFSRDEKFMHHARWNAPLSSQLQQSVDSDEFKVFIESIIGKKVNNFSAAVSSFQHRDFEILHDDHTQQEELLVFIDFSDDLVDDAGGDLVFTNGVDQVRHFPVQKNSLIIVKKPKDFHFFVKYVNNHAEQKRRMLCSLRVKD